MLEVGQRLLEEGDEAGLRRGVQLPLQPRGEHLGLDTVLDQTLTWVDVRNNMNGSINLMSCPYHYLDKLSDILGHGVGLVAGQPQQRGEEVAALHLGLVVANITLSDCNVRISTP